MDLNNLGLNSKSVDDIGIKFDIVGFLVSHNLPFSAGSEILNLFQSLIERYEITTIMKTKIYHQCITSISKDCEGAYLQEQLFLRLVSSPFSISVDGGLDEFGGDYLAMSAVSTNSNEPEIHFLGLLEVTTSSTVYMKRLLNLNFSIKFLFLKKSMNFRH